MGLRENISSSVSALGDAFKWFVGFVVGAVLVVVVGIILWTTHVFLSAPNQNCSPTVRGDLVAVDPLWRLAKAAPDAKIAIALDDVTNRTRKGRQSLTVHRTTRNTSSAAIAAGQRIGAFLLGGLSDGTRDAAVRWSAAAHRTPDGRSISVRLCARRLRRSEARPGRYGGTLRVAGKRVVASDIPVEITVKSSRVWVGAVVLFMSLVGAGLAASNAKPPELDQAKISQKPVRHAALAALPILSAVVAGVAAGLIVYADDATWGAHVGSDTAKLITASFAGATGGLAVTTGGARRARQNLAPK